MLDKNSKLKIFAPSDTLAVVLLNGLDEKYSKPQPADADGHLTPAIKAAATGKHTVVFGYTLASLPDELQHGRPARATAGHETPLPIARGLRNARPRQITHAGRSREGEAGRTSEEAEKRCRYSSR